MKQNMSIRKLCRDNRHLRHKIKDLKKSLLYALLEQSINPLHTPQQLAAILKENCGFSFHFPYFCLMLLFNAPGADSNGDPADATSISSNWALHKDSETGLIVNTQCDVWSPHWDDSVREIIEEMLKNNLDRDNRTDFYFLRADRDLCCLMNYGQPGAIDMIITGMNDMIEQLYNQYNLKVSVAVSQEKYKDFNLQECYEECLMIHDYGWNLNMSVLTYDQFEMPIYSATEFKPEASNATQSIVMLERRFLNYVTMRAFVQANHTLSTLNDYLIDRQRIALNKLVALTFHRLQNVLSICCEDMDQRDIRQITDILTMIENIRSFPDLKSKIGMFFSCMDQALQPRQQNDTDRAEAVISYIEGNYQNPNLGATMICENLHMSATYLSRIMKQETGQGLVATIHNIRLREAQHLLRDTALSLDQIAVHVGFTNRWILIRSFKSYLGMTPSDFRQDPDLSTG